MKIFSPEGRVGREITALATAPEVLSGSRIGVLDNGKPGAALLMETLANELVRRTGATFVGTFRKGSAATPCEPELLSRIAEAADLVLTGSADWGSCTSWSLHDTVELEAAGVPCAVVVTDRFAAIAQRAATGFGLPEARRVVVAHPIGGLGEDEIASLGRGALDAGLACLTASR